MNLDTPAKFSSSTVVLHWIIGLTMLGLLGSGIYMTEFEVYALYDWHKSIGILIFVFAVWRVMWRLRNGWPTTVGETSDLMHGVAKLVHYLLLIGTVLLPLSGFIMSSMGGYGAAVFGFELVAANPDPANPAEMIPINGAIAGIAHETHHLSGYIILAGVLLHLAGAFKHHLINQDGTLRRMLGAEV